MLTLLLSTVTFSQVGSSWRDWNNPSRFEKNFNYNFDRLPLQGDIGKETGKGWSGSYWPTHKGGIAYRWNHPNPRNFKYISPSKENIMSMSSDEIAMLSPAEKYDIFMSRYDYPLTRRVLSSTRESAKEWRGICHGWAPASLHHVEPSAISVQNNEGVQINFGSSDVKALLSYYYAIESKSQVRQVAKRCFGKANPRGNCKGVNPGAFHIIIANYIGLRSEGFLADVDRYKEVWNQAVVSYHSEIIGYKNVRRRDRKRNIVEKIMIKTRMSYVEELDINAGNPDLDFEDTPMWDPVFGTIFQQREEVEYFYTISLNSRGQIIDGEWDGYQRPDFLWTKKKDTFKGYFSGINKIYKPIF